MEASPRAVRRVQPPRAADILSRAEAAYKGAVVDPAAFRGVAAQVLRDAQRAQQTEAVVVALRAKAWAEHELLNNTAAKALLDRAVRLARQQELSQRLVEVLLSRAAVRTVLGRFDQAERDLREAASAVGTPSAELLLQQATLLANRGRFVEAAPLYRAVLADRSCPAEVSWKVANNLAMIEGLSGRPRQGVRFAGRAAALATGLGPVPVAIAAQTRAWVTMQAGRLPESMRMFEQAGALYRAAGLPPGEHHIEYADALLGLRLLPEALAVAQDAAQQLHQQHAPLMAAEAELRLARLQLTVGDAEAASDAATRAAALLRRQRRSTWVALAVSLSHQARARTEPLTGRQVRSLAGCAATLQGHGLLSDAVDAYRVLAHEALRCGRGDAAVRSLERAHLSTVGAPVLVRVKGRLAAAEYAAVVGDPTGVLRHARAGLADLEGHRAALPSMELRALASGHGTELGTLGLRTLVPQRSAGRLFAWLERTRAAALLTADAPVPEELAGRLATLRTLQAELAAEVSATGRAAPEQLERIADTELSIRRATWTGAQGDTVRAGDRVTAGAIAQLLTNEALVEYGLLDGQAFAVVLDGRRPRFVELGEARGVGADVDALLLALRRLTRTAGRAHVAPAVRAAVLALLERVRTRLVAPLGVPPDQPLVVVPVGDLQRLPWAPLHPAPVSVAPSAAFWARTREAGWERPKSVALVAGPDLPGAAHEVTELAALHPSATVLTPPHSTVAAALAAMEGTWLAHLACHGSVRVDNPTFSSLQLSDGPLTVHELGLSRAAPHGIVLAACDSGVQARYPGDEALGFVSALLARGTAAVMASGVPVPDLEALPLLRAVHERVRSGATLASALHAARAQVDLEPSGSFVSWCAFDVYGAG